MQRDQSRQEARGPRRLDLHLPPAPEEIRGARDALRTLGAPQRLLDDAKLLLTELLTNSLRHSNIPPGETIRVRAQWSGSSLRVSVHDGLRMGIPPQVGGEVPPSATGTSGWGFFLVDRIADRWGADEEDGYWFELEGSSDGGRR
ncbi:MAG: ATP-binding protein [Actinomycetota bacterium]|nr:ATP-binding protein [Actinomycetota bacterium]